MTGTDLRQLDENLWKLCAFDDRGREERLTLSYGTEGWNVLHEERDAEDWRIVGTVCTLQTGGELVR
jgi:hypothetical protein